MQYDPDLKTYVRGERHREKLLQEKGIADVRDWNSPESIQNEAARNLAERRREINKPTNEAIKKALHDANAGEDFIPALEASIDADAKRQEAEQDRARQINRENAEEDARRWERDHRR